MSLASEARSEIPYRKRSWVDEQLGDEAAEFAALLADPNVPYKAIWRALEKRGIHLPDRTVYQWAVEARR